MDADGDGYGDTEQPVELVGCYATEGYSDEPGDCDDTNAEANPGGIDHPFDDVDQDCDGLDSCGVVDYSAATSFLGEEDAEEMAAWCDQYQEATGTFVVSGMAGADLTPLSCVCRLRSTVGVALMPDLTSLHGLEGLETLDFATFISQNPLLTSLEGLEGLTTGEGTFWIDENNSLQSLRGLDNLVSFGGINVEFNDQYPERFSTEGLESLTTLSGSLTLGSSRGMPDLRGLESLRHIASRLILYDHADLESLDGLQSLEYIGGWLELSDAPLVQDLAPLSNVTSLSGLVLERTGVRDLGGLAHATTNHAYYLGIEGNPFLESIAGYRVEGSVGGTWMRVEDNDALETLEGFEGITSIVGWLIIRGNASLRDISALHNVTSVDSITITNNPSLSDADAWALVDAIGIGNIPGPISIAGNGP